VSDDLLGFVSLARLTSGSPAVDDVGAFAWSQLRSIAPGATLAIFTLDESRTSVVARFVAGSATQRIPAMTIGVGERITGWVAANARSMVDADAALDLGKGFDDVVRFAVSIPLVTEGGVIGVMTLYSPELFGHQLALKIEMIGPHLARAVASAVAGAPAGVSTVADTEHRASKRRGLSLVSRR
jgi:hypothetical protein